MEKTMKTFLKEHPHLWFQGYWIIYLIWFFYLEAVTAPQYIVHCFLDDMIPFCEWFIFPYISWFPMLAWAFAFLWLRDGKSYDKLCLMAFSGMSLCLIIYMLWPNGLALRPQGLPRENIASSVMALLWQADTPSNVCPSIHCQTSAAIALAVTHSKPLEGKTAAQLMVIFWAALICASTVFTKQHSAVDVVLGAAMAVPWYFALYRKEKPLLALAAK